MNYGDLYQLDAKCDRCGKPRGDHKLDGGCPPAKPMTDDVGKLVERLRQGIDIDRVVETEQAMDAGADMLERLSERCEAYKGQVMVGGQVINDTAEALGCPPDNEKILEAIHKLRVVSRLPTEGEIARKFYEFAGCTDVRFPLALDDNCRAYARAVLSLFKGEGK